MRRLPVYLLLDTSGSMKGEPIESVKVGLAAMLSNLRQDPFALESVWLSVITFDRDVKQLIPLTELENFILPEIVTPDSGPTHLGEALNFLLEAVRREVVMSSESDKGDWKPLLFVMTDGSPSDLQKFNSILPDIKAFGFGNIISCAAGPKAKDSYLKEFSDSVVYLDTTDSATFQSFFKWVSASVSVGNRSQGVGEKTDLPPPPPGIQIVI